jgi:hypothetical protein
MDRSVKQSGGMILTHHDGHWGMPLVPPARKYQNVDGIVDLDNGLCSAAHLRRSS